MLQVGPGINHQWENQDLKYIETQHLEWQKYKVSERLFLAKDK